MSSGLAFWATMALIGLAVFPAAWVLGREALARRRTRLVLALIDQARAMVDGAGGERDDRDGTAELARSLRARFDARTNERVVVALLRSAEPRARLWGSRLFAELGLVEVYAKRLRHGRRWSDREHAAETLGLAGVASTVPVLVEALRDPNEDETSVKSAAASALARLRDETAIPLLAAELAGVDDQSSRQVAEAMAAFGALAVPALLELLVDPARTGARVWAARILGRIADARAVEALVGRMHDRDDRLRMAVAEALGAIGDPRALQPLVRATLRDPAPQVRAHAAGAVARVEGPRAVDVLVAALADPDYATRIRALEAFETMRIEDTAPLEAALRDPNADVRRRAALALERVGYLERIIKDLTSHDRMTRTHAYAGLVALGEVGLADSVASYLHFSSFEVRAVVARACGDLGIARLGTALLRAIDDEAWPVRAAVCEALGRLHHEAAPPALIHALEDGEEVVREAAAEALTTYAADVLTPHVASFAATYERGSIVVRRSLVVIVGRIEDPAADALIVRAASDPSDMVRLPAVIALDRRPEEVKVGPLIARLTDASLDVRMAAITALGSTAGAEVFEGLLRALSGANNQLRERLAQSLARGPRQALLARLPELEMNESPDVRIGMAWTLGKIGDPAGVPTLTRFLRSDDAAIRASAAGALAKIAHPSACNALFEAAGDPDARVRAAVVNSLSRVEGGTGRALETFASLARDPDAFVRDRALIAFANAAGPDGETRARAMAIRAAPAARTVALALIGTEASMTTVFEDLAQPKSFDAIVTFLDHEHAGVRAAFFAAVRLEDPANAESPAEATRIVAQYEKALRTNLDVSARLLAVQGLAQLGFERAVPALCDAATGDPDEAVRLRATRALGPSAADGGARRALVRAIGDPSSLVAMAAARAVTQVRGPDVTAALERRLGAGTEELRDVVEETLADLHRDDPTPFVDWMMGVDVADLLAPAVRVLARMANPTMLPLFERLLRHGSPLVRVETVRALARLPFTDVVKQIEAATQDPNEDVRLAVVEGAAGIPDALTRLAMLRRDPSVRVRTAAASSLEHLRGASSRGAVRALEAMLADASPLVRAAALTSLAGSREPEGLLAFGQAWGRVSLDARLDLRREPRAAAISDRIARRLTSSSDADERRCAITALGAFAAPGCAAWIVPALGDPSAEVRIAAIQALASTDDAQARQAVSNMVSDPDSGVREAARRTVVRSVG